MSKGTEERRQDGGVFIEAMHECYAEGKEPGPKEILEAMTRTIPLANLIGYRIGALLHWA